MNKDLPKKELQKNEIAYKPHIDCTNQKILFLFESVF